ncbi:MAG: tetratricopeptide repeat protein [Prochlorotrichaceae cyanobacterium]|jgi:predicted Zn-dependent protease
MTEPQTLEDLFDEGLERYKAGEAPESLIPLFQTLCDRSSKNSVSWTCLSWLYLLTDKPSQAIKAAKKAIKLNPHDPQARINLAVALLDAGQKGVREHIDVAQQIIMVAPEDIKQEVVGNIQDGFDRKPDWKSLERVKSWLFST